MYKHQIFITKIMIAILLIAGSLLLGPVANAVSADFAIESYSNYSNAKGDRSSSVRVRNITSGGRIIDSSDFIAVLADGTEVRGERGDNNRVDSGSTGSIMVHFGQHDWPIANIKLN